MFPFQCYSGEIMVESIHPSGEEYKPKLQAVMFRMTFNARFALHFDTLVVSLGNFDA